jgi:FtsZ-binding cell division protein ZapB
MNYETGMKKNFLGETPKDRRNNVIVILLVMILAVMLFLFFSQRRNNRLIVNEITAQKDSIQVELTQIIVGYDSLKVENDTLTMQMVGAQSKVKDLLLEVEQTKKMSLQQINRYQKEVTTLRDIMRNYVVQIDSLNRRNKILMAENLEVKEQARQVESRNTQLSQEKEQLEQTLKRAATLEVREVMASGLNDREKDTRFAERTTMIRVNFIVSQNVTAKRGSKNIYLRIMRPDQLLLNKSSGDLFEFEDLKIPYSAVREINYEGNDIPVAIYWDNKGEQPLVPGNYTIDLFADGSNIGTTVLTLK